MENTNRDTTQGVAPQNDWREDETNAWLTDTSISRDNELTRMESTGDGAADEDNQQLYVSSGKDDPDRDDDDEEEDDDDDEEEDDDTEENEEDEDGDWGHVDPAEGNSPFPDSNDPSGPGSAV